MASKMIVEEQTLPCRVVLVNWLDEEGIKHHHSSHMESHRVADEPTLYWGHYYYQFADAMADFVERCKSAGTEIDHDFRPAEGELYMAPGAPGLGKICPICCKEIWAGEMYRESQEKPESPKLYTHEYCERVKNMAYTYIVNRMSIFNSWQASVYNGAGDRIWCDDKYQSRDEAVLAIKEKYPDAKVMSGWTP